MAENPRSMDLPLELPDFGRLRREISFHEDQALRRRFTLKTAEDYAFDLDGYLSHESWIKDGIEKLGDLKGKLLLDLGCGHGMASVVFATQGALVTAMDISAGYVAEATQRAKSHGVRINGVVGCGELLPFKDEAFELIWGNAILHHLDIRFAVREVMRVLKPGGVAVFCEPINMSFILKLARNWFSPKDHTSDEQPLGFEEIKMMKEISPGLEWQGHQLLGSFGKIVRMKILASSFDFVDKVTLGMFPFAKKFCRYGMFKLNKK